MLSKKKRLTRDEFNRFFSSGTHLHTPTFTCVFSGQSATHIAVVVPKKVLPNAVDRNALRRRVYNTVESAIKTTGVYILVAKKGAAKVHKTDIPNEVRAVIKKVDTAATGPHTT